MAIYDYVVKFEVFETQSEKKIVNITLGTWEIDESSDEFVDGDVEPIRILDKLWRIVYENFDYDEEWSSSIEEEESYSFENSKYHIHIEAKRLIACDDLSNFIPKDRVDYFFEKVKEILASLH